MTHEELDALWNKSVDISITAGDGLARYRYAEYVAAAEQEACAQVCDYAATECSYGSDGWYTAKTLAAAIRARGSK